MSDHKTYNTPLLKKIGIKENDKILVINNPIWIKQLLSEENHKIDSTYENGKSYHVIWVFENTIKGLETHLKKAGKSIVSNGMIWISWHKKASKLRTELTEDIIRDTALALDLVDVKVASIDDIWSALKMVIPVSRRNT